MVGVGWRGGGWVGAGVVVGGGGGRVGGWGRGGGWWWWFRFLHVASLLNTPRQVLGGLAGLVATSFFTKSWPLPGFHQGNTGGCLDKRCLDMQGLGPSLNNARLRC